MMPHQHAHIPETMLAMILEAPGKPLVLKNLPMPVPSAGQVLIKVIACGVSLADLHMVDGKLPHARLPLIPGREIIGTVAARGAAVQQLEEGDLVGIPPRADDTASGGYATFTLAQEQHCFVLPPRYANASGVVLLRSVGDPGAVNTNIQAFELHQANEALQLLRSGETDGVAVLVMPLEA